GRDPRQPVRADRLDHARLGQHPDLVGTVGEPVPGVRNPRRQIAEIHALSLFPGGCKMSRLGYPSSSSATAMQAIPSPRPTQPIPSLPVALTLTRAEVTSARVRSIRARCEARR